jgi:serine/threonine-protein kinase
MVMGTAHYIAPEQAVGQEAEPASDVYSLAVVGYECLAGRRPFLSENAVTVAMMHIREVPPPLPPDVPPGVRALIEATLVKDPRQRYRSGGEFAAAVGAVRAGLPLPAPSGLAMAIPMQQQRPPHGGPPTYPPGAIPVVPPQVPPSGAPMSPGTGTFLLGPPPQPRPNRTGLWVLLALLVVILVGLLAVWGIREWQRSGSSGTEGTGRPATAKLTGDRPAQDRCLVTVTCAGRGPGG